MSSRTYRAFVLDSKLSRHKSILQIGILGVKRTFISVLMRETTALQSYLKSQWPSV
jgi:hypothetical protein